MITSDAFEMSDHVLWAVTRTPTYVRLIINVERMTPERWADAREAAHRQLDQLIERNTHDSPGGAS